MSITVQASHLPDLKEISADCPRAYLQGFQLSVATFPIFRVVPSTHP
jgi:hypothetical protein